jgi:hypothetical protein
MLYLALAVGLAISNSSVKEPGIENSVHGKFVQFYNEDKYDSLVKLFHYPENQNRKEHVEDSTILVGLFKGMKNSFGKIIGTKIQKNQDSNFVSVHITTADSGYWNHQRTSERVINNVIFEKRGLVSIAYRNRIQDMNKEIGKFELYKALPDSLNEEQIQMVKEGLDNLYLELIQSLSAPKPK